MPPKRTTVPMSRADQVRNLWAEFEIWHTEQLAQLDERIQKALQEIDQNRKPAGGKKKNKGKDKEKDQEIEKKKAEARKDIEKSFGGDVIREEWQSRLNKAGLFDQDWDNMTENEQRKVEKILGVDLDEDVAIIETAPPPPAPLAPTSVQRTSPSSMFTPPMASSSRTDVLSDNYAFVDPTTFSTEAIEAEGTGTFDNWLEVRQRIKSDDEISLDASTTSSWGGGNEVPAYLAWSSELSRSSAQSSQTSLSGSPERLMSKLPGSEPFQSNLVSSAVNRLTLFGDDDTPNTKRQADTAHPDPVRAGRTSFRSLDHTMHGVHPSGSSASSSVNKRSKSRPRYIGPELVDREEETVEAQQFKEFKRMVRVQKIREFHDEATQADIDLAIVIDEAIQSRTESKEVTARLVEEHEQAMLRLRQRKEEERKGIVEKERQRRLAEFDQRKRQHNKPVVHHPPTLSPQDEASLAGIGIDRSVLTDKFLRELQFGPDAASSSAAVSDTPTIRSHLNRMRLPISEWLNGASNDSGTDTPTPTIPSSGWQFDNAPATTSTLADAPSFKRLPSGLAKSISVDSTTSSVQSDTAPTTQLYASAIEADDAKVAPPSSKTSKGQVAKTKVESNKKKGKNQPVVVQAEGSSKTKPDQMSQDPQANSAIKNEPSAGSGSLSSTGTSPPTTFSKSSLPPPPVPLASRPNIAATPAPMWNLSQSLNIDTMARNVTQSTQQLSGSHLQVPSSSAAIDNRQRWVPPVAGPTTTTAPTDEKRPQPSRTLTEPPSKIKKSLTSESTIIQPPPEGENSRLRRVSDPIAPSPRSFDYPNGKAAAKAPAPATVKAPAPAPVKAPAPVPVKAPAPAPVPASVKAPAKANDPPSGILKTTLSSKSSGKTSSKSSKVKKVTIEDVKDEQEEAEETHEHLPTDSRYIMEPKPVVAQGMFSQIIQFNEEEAPQAKANKVKTAPVVAQPSQSQQIRKQEPASGSSSSSSSSTAPQKSNQMWIPPQSSMAEAKAKSADKVSASRMPGHFEDEVAAVPPVDKHVRWTANTKVIEDEGGERFLSGLDELQRFLEQQEKEAKKLREGWQQRPDTDRALTNASDGRVGTSVGISVGTSSSMTGKSAGSHQNGLFWNPKASTSTSTHRKPLATS